MCVINTHKEALMTDLPSPPHKDSEEYTDGKRLAFRSVLNLLKELEDEK